MINKDELNEIETAFYSDENQDNYNLAEWARLIIPTLIEELRNYVPNDNDELDFPVDEQKLKDFLAYFENQEYKNTGMSMFAGGYAIAEYDGYEVIDDDDEDSELLFVLRWGEQDVDGNVEHTEYYRISIADFEGAKNSKEIYKKLRG